MNLKFVLNLLFQKFRRGFSVIAQYLSPGRWAMLLQGFIVKTFTKLTDVKPKHQRDYYNILKWQVSKKVAYLAVCVIGLLCAIYVANLASTYIQGMLGDGIKVYSYDSGLLKFHKGVVKIKAKSGYIAYVGNVEKGYTTGNGTLYRKDGSLCYTGNFEESMFNGDGDLYYPNGNKNYTGEFKDNLFEGKGRLYRENSTLEYDGEFVEGKKDGHGILYNTGGNQVYDGTFSRDHLVYSELLGGTGDDTSSHYSGAYDIFSQNNDNVLYLKEIDAAILSNYNENTLTEGATVNVVYVLKDVFHYGDSSIDNVADLKDVLDLPTYEGNAYVNLGEAVCINVLNQKNGFAMSGPVDMEKSEVMDGYSSVDSFDEAYLLYLYVYQKDGIVYSFVAPDQGADFEFYYMQQIEGSAATE